MWTEALHTFWSKSTAFPSMQKRWLGGASARIYCYISEGCAQVGVVPILAVPRWVVNLIVVCMYLNFLYPA